MIVEFIKNEFISSQAKEDLFFNIDIVVAKQALVI